MKTEASVSDMISCGQLSVVQGSKLGPLLFVLFINDIVSLPLNGKLYLFADDITLIVEVESYEELQRIFSQSKIGSIKTNLF